MDFTDLNAACPKDPYILLDIDHLFEGSSCYHVLSFMDAYLRYNQIKMDPLDSPKTAFMSNHGNYYFNFMYFGLKNADTTYQRFMHAIFSHQIRRNIKVYVDDMIIFYLRID